jgi:hypothetical protein
MIPVYLNFSNCTINTIQVHKNGCKWHPYFIAICFRHVWPSLGSLHLLSSPCEIKGSHLLTQFWLLSAFQNLFCLLTVMFLLLCIVITQMSRHSSLSTLSWFQTDRAPSETALREGTFLMFTHLIFIHSLCFCDNYNIRYMSVQISD